jgi:hypothetical protein
MSHEKLKNIKIDKSNMKVIFMSKSNNTTGDYKSNECSISEFVLNCWGKIYQHSNNKVNSLINEMQKHFESLGYNSEKLWSCVYPLFGTDEENAIKKEVRSIFFKYCDKVNNL